jgi:hypothetical protein
MQSALSLCACVHTHTHTHTHTHLRTTLQVALVEWVHPIPPLWSKLLSLKYNGMEQGQCKAYAPQLRRLRGCLEKVIGELREVLVKIGAKALGRFVGQLYAYLRRVHVHVHMLVFLQILCYPLSLQWDNSVRRPKNNEISLHEQALRRLIARWCQPGFSRLRSGRVTEEQEQTPDTV